MDRVLDETYARVNELAEVGRYPFPVDDTGDQIRRGVQGPEYMRRQRARVKRAGVRILDHSPIAELLVDASGAVAGASGTDLTNGARFEVRAGAVVLASGGCAFKSGTLGCNVNTGDGALMAAEVGAELSGMEFSNAYAIAPKFASVTKTAYYSYATFYRADGSVIEGAGSQQGRSVIARTLLDEPVFAIIDKADATVQRDMRLGQPNFFLPFDRQGIDPFTDPFPVTLLLEGTVRGTGGIRVAAEDLSTSLPGLYVAGDVATRELICGGFTGGGSHNAAWAISSGSWAGAAAARHARSIGTRTRAARPAGRVGVRPDGRATVSAADTERIVQEQVFPFETNLFRTAARLETALSTLDGVWHEIRAGLAGGYREREAAAMTAHARWMFTAALSRTESRGMHKRLDFPQQDPGQHHRLITGGLDSVWSVPEPQFLGRRAAVTA